jgi:hypothetical protein
MTVKRIKREHALQVFTASHDKHGFDYLLDSIPEIIQKKLSGPELGDLLCAIRVICQKEAADMDDVIFSIYENDL